jgi:hypothetical protein
VAVLGAGVAGRSWVARAIQKPRPMPIISTARPTAAAIA